MPERRGGKVAVSLWAALRIWMGDCSRVVERRHEHRPFCHTARPLRLREILDRFAGYHLALVGLLRVAAMFGDAG